MAFLAALVATLHVALSAPGHTPKVNVHWNYTVRATVAGKLVRGRITAEIVDPIGGHHPVEFGLSTRKIASFPFDGVFRDFIIWPRESRGVPLTLRITVVTAHARRVVSYRVVPRA
jgi:hypothetical protein